MPPFHHPIWSIIALAGIGCEPVLSDETDSPDTDVIDDTDIVDDTDEADSFSLLTLNLHCFKLDGTSFASNTDRFEAIATAANEVDALALQEACKRDGVSAMERIRLFLEEQTGDTWSGAWTLAHTAWEGTPDEAEEGVALIVRGDIHDVETWTYFAQSSLQRVAVGATLDNGVFLVSTHLEHSDGEVRLAQARQTASWALAAKNHLDVVVAGDLNAKPGSDPVNAIEAMGFGDSASSLTADRIDHVHLHRGAAWLATEAKILFDGNDTPLVSDHPGVLVHFDVASAPVVEVTRIIATADVGFGHFVSVRGDGEPLSWNHGWPAWAAADDEWRLILTEVSGPFAYKTLVDDVTWQEGDDVSGTSGSDNLVTPTF
ncbi:MAG: hypothetical protein HN348_26440 [Proteobacteria bacterium]|nr:hypothetical protein [Pseudomonadota bacterium]